MEDKQKIFDLLSAGRDNAKIAQSILKSQPELKKELEEELLPILQTVHKKTLRAFPNFIAEFNTHFHHAARADLVEIWFDSDLLSAHVQALDTLDLRDKGLHKLPNYIEQLPNLKNLYLFATCLSKLPDFIGNLEHLEHLLININELVTLPKSLSKLQNLKHLGLRKNKFTVVPECIGDLQNLKELDLGDNEIYCLPEFLANLKQLEVLSLAKMPIQKLPDFIQEFTNLKHLYLFGSNVIESERKRIEELLPNCTVFF